MLTAKQVKKTKAKPKAPRKVKRPEPVADVDEVAELDGTSEPVEEPKSKPEPKANGQPAAVTGVVQLDLPLGPIGEGYLPSHLDIAFTPRQARVVNRVFEGLRRTGKY